MEQIYTKMWDLAKPYYKKGRAMDVDHIEWMMKVSMKLCEKEKIDNTIFVPLVIFHDVGYTGVYESPYNLSIRKGHMKKGSVIARKILLKLKYPKKKIEKICDYISVHDNWYLKDYTVYKDKTLSVFHDLDFIWMATEKGFKAMKKILGYNSKEMLSYIEEDENHNKVPFGTKFTKNMYQKLINERKNIIV